MTKPIRTRKPRARLIRTVFRVKEMDMAIIAQALLEAKMTIEAQNDGMCLKSVMVALDFIETLDKGPKDGL